MGLLDFISKSTTGDGQSSGQAQDTTQQTTPAAPASDVQYPLPQNSNDTPFVSQGLENYTVSGGNIPSAKEIPSSTPNSSNEATENPVSSNFSTTPVMNDYSSIGEPEIEDLTKYATQPVVNNNQPMTSELNSNTTNSVDLTNTQADLTSNQLDVTTPNPLPQAQEGFGNLSENPKPLIEGIDTSLPQSPVIESGEFPPVDNNQTNGSVVEEEKPAQTNNDLALGSDVVLGNDEASPQDLDSNTNLTSENQPTDELLENQGGDEVVPQNESVENEANMSQNLPDLEENKVEEVEQPTGPVLAAEKVEESNNVDPEAQTSETITGSSELDSEVNNETEVNKVEENVYENNDQGSSFEFKKIRNVGFLGLNSNASGNQDEIADLALKLSDHDLRIYLDSNKNIGKSILDKIKDNKGAHITTVHLKPFYSNYSDEDGETPNMSDYTVVVYSDFLEKLKYFIRECEAFVFPNTGGLLNLSALTTLLSFQYLYLGFHKPVILIGNEWRNVIEDLKSKNLLSEQDISSIIIAENSDQAMDHLKKSEEELLSNSKSKSKKFYDYREDFDEYEYMN